MVSHPDPKMHQRIQQLYVTNKLDNLTVLSGLLIEKRCFWLSC